MMCLVQIDDRTDTMTKNFITIYKQRRSFKTNVKQWEINNQYIMWLAGAK